jgi:prepilin-type N-terminal cleavage/methylation domain-containing protein
MKTKAFTLLELVIVVIIIGVLATLALAGMFDVIERSRIAEAFAAAQTIRSAMERYALMNNGSYEGIEIGFNGDYCNHDWSVLAIGNPSCTPNSHFGYDVYGAQTLSGEPGFTIGCTRNDHEQFGPSKNGSIVISYPAAGGSSGGGYGAPTPEITICGMGYYAGIYGSCT